MSRQVEIQELIIKHHRRLQKLEEKKATLGINTPPEILTEIEDIEQEIENLQTELKKFDGVVETEEKPPTSYPESATDKQNNFALPTILAAVLVIFLISVCVVNVTGFNLKTLLETIRNPQPGVTPSLKKDEVTQANLTLVESSTPTTEPTYIPTPIPNTPTPVPVETTLLPTPTTLDHSESYTPTINDFGTGYKYVLIPAGSADDGTGVTYEFWIGAYEVTNGQFVDYLNRTDSNNKCRNGSICVNTEVNNARIVKDGRVWKAVEEYKNHPVTGVTWYGATDFCRELDSGLPTLAEWSKAASWHPVTKQTAPYPWGNASPSPERANYESNGTQPVGSYPSGRSVIGAYDMSGNVWELVADTIGTNRIWRGGGWDSPAGQITTTAETRKGASTASNNLGFRCARS